MPKLTQANTPSLYQHSGQKPKNIFVHILVQTKSSLRPFRILLTFSRQERNPKGVDETHLKVANSTPIATIGDQILIVLI